MNWFRKVMAGRYGGDHLGIALIVFAMALTVITMFLPVPLLSYLSLVPLAFALFRMMSKNIPKRQSENYRFLLFTRKISSWFRGVRAGLRDRRFFRFFRCGKCGQKVRVPKGKGKICITCPKCGGKFVKKT